MKNLLVFTENYQRGGGNRYMIDLVNGMQEDFEQVIILSNPGGLFEEDLERCNAEYKLLPVFFLTRSLVFNNTLNWPKFIKKALLLLLLPLEPILFLFNLAVMWKMLVKNSPSLILVCNGGYPASHACIAILAASRLARYPAIMSVVSTPSPRRPFLLFWDRLLDFISLRCSKTIIVNAKSIALKLQSLRSIPIEHITLIYNGLEDIFLIRDHNHNDYRLVIGCICRLDRMKGILVLIESFAILANDYPSIQLVLVGEGDVSEEIHLRVKELGLQKRVHLLGHLKGDSNLLLASFDIYAFPSFWEGLPYSILEAMRSGCAIVTTSVGGIPEAIQDRINGLLVPPGEIEALAAAISELVNDNFKRILLGNNARKIFETQFSLNQMHHNTKLLLKSLIKL